MFTFPIITFKEVEVLHNYDSVLEPLISNGWNIVEYKEFLEFSELRAIMDDKEFLGFFLCEPMSDSIEVHAFVLPEHRNRSKSVLEAFKAYLVGDLGFLCIKTTVTGDFEPLVRFLKMLDFKVTNIEYGVVTKGTGIFGATYLEYVKE